MRNTQNNNNGNYGQIGVRNYELTGLTLANPCVITDLTYSGSSGQSFTFTFPYTECCTPAAALRTIQAEEYTIIDTQKPSE
jgi:hypothetical protein